MRQAKTTTRSKRATKQESKPTPTARTRNVRARDFTIAQKVTAVTAALTANPEHPLGQQALRAAQVACGQPIHISTLDDWLRLYRAQVEPTLHSKPIEQTILEQRDSTLADMNSVRQLAIGALKDEKKIATASWRDSAVVLGIVHDKIEDSIGLAPDMVAIARRWQALCASAGWDAAAMWSRYCDGLEAKMQAALILSPAETSPALPATTSADNDNS